MIKTKIAGIKTELTIGISLFNIKYHFFLKKIFFYKIVINYFKLEIFIKLFQKVNLMEEIKNLAT